jgi:beta-phosphoglucomutase-like phosphatase (HAD superfamily)
MKAVLFDLDGTLIDSEGLYNAATIELVEAAGGKVSDAEVASWPGCPISTLAGVVARFDGRPKPVLEALITQRVREQVAGNVPWVSGAKHLLTDLAARNVPCALVSMSHASYLEAVLEDCEPGWFQATVSGDDPAIEPKPHPSPYLLAAARLGLDPSECIALEDSDIGEESAKRAGMRTIRTRVGRPLPGPAELLRATSPWGRS